jgi:hypothetical protein
MSIDVKKSGILALPWPAALDVCLGGSLRSGEVCGPESVQEVPHSSQAVGANQEQVAGALAPFGDKTCASKDPQMVRDDLL